MTTATCPSPAEVERLYLGGFPEEFAVEALEEHVLGCGSCFDKLKKLVRTNDTLVGVLNDNPRNDTFASSPLVADLKDKLKSLRPTAASAASNRDAAMIQFSCSACQKQLSVHADATGKKAQCPACGQVMAVPAKVAVAPAGRAAGKVSGGRQRSADPSAVEQT